MSIRDRWPVPGAFDLDGRVVDVWPVRIDAASMTPAFEAVLSVEEKDRSVRFRFDHLRHSYVLAHGALRLLLSRYLNTSPKSIEFTFGQNGKPRLHGNSCLRFNISHSGAIMACALTLGLEIGIDVEEIRSMQDLEGIARHTFCGGEVEDLMSLPPDQRESSFFRCWTRKEAYIKAVGEGLSARLDAFRVTLRPEDPARFLYVGNEERAAQQWTLHNLDLTPGYAGALAYRDAERPVRVFPLLGPADLLDVC